MCFSLLTMATSLAAPTFFMMAFPFTLQMYKPTICMRGTKKGPYFSRNMPNLTQASGLQINRHIKAHLKSGGDDDVPISPSTSPTGSQKNKEIASLPLEILKQQLIWNMISSKITLVSKANKERWKFNDGKAMQLEDKIAEPTNGRLLENGLVFQQDFTVRSFEIGCDFRISIEALQNYLQETALNHMKTVGLLADGFGSTPEMIARDLIWVVCWLNIEVDCYPSWSDVVQVSTWIFKPRRIGVHREWRVHDFKTGKTLIRATSLFVMMNKKTRKFAQLDEEIMKDIKPHLMHCDPMVNKDSIKLLLLDTDKADYARTGLTSVRTDMDVNQHVSHIKVLNFVLESVPCSVVESHELSAITLEYRKECHRGNLLQSFSGVVNDSCGSSSNRLMDNGGIEFDHLLCVENKQEIVRARTVWKPKNANNSIQEVHNLAGSAWNE